MGFVVHELRFGAACLASGDGFGEAGHIKYTTLIITYL
jgi:hypothetical protein